MKDRNIETHVRWFSATGNSLAAARSLATALGASSCESLLGPAGGRSDDRPARYVFVFPLYYLGPPKAVDDALRAFPLKEGDDICVVVTRGFKNIGAIFGILGRLFRERGARLRYGAYVDMPNNDLILFSVRPEKDNKAWLERVPARLDAVALDIASGRSHRDLEPVFFMGGTRQRHYRSHILGSHERFFADSSCSGCGLCARLCPLGRIEMAGGRPAWKAGCQECEACINLCPKGSIQYRGSATEGKARYRHPDVAWKDIAAQRS